MLATGLASNPEALHALEKAGVPIQTIGDVDGPGYLEGAIHDGFHAARAL